VDLQNSATFQSLIGQVTLVAPPTSTTEARENFGAFLSLVNLTSFALKPNSIEANVFLQTGSLRNTELALKLEQDKVLSPEQIDNGEQNFTDTWLADRIATLKWIGLANSEDLTDSESVFQSSSSKHYYDFTTSRGIHLTGQGDEQQILFGNSTDNGAIAGR
jgi:hypothetical protein